MIAEFRQLGARMQRKVSMIVARAILTLIDDAHGLQLVQALAHGGDVWDRLQRFQEYGFTSSPLPGAEAIVVSMAGLRGAGIVIATDDRRYRLQVLKNGDAALYDYRGQFVWLRSGGIHMKAVGKLRLEGDVVEIVAHTTRRDDVGGFATEMTWTGGDAYTQTTWQLGAVITEVPHAVNPPQEFVAF